MTTKYTTDHVRELDKTEFDLIAFSLSGKVAGRITSIAMSLAGSQIRLAKHLESSDQPAIDLFNESMSELEGIEAQNEFFTSAGQGEPVNKEDQLKAWLGVRQALIERNYIPSPLSENFRWMIEQTIGRNNPSEDDIQKLADSSSLSTEQLTDIYKVKSERSVQETVEVSKFAMGLINNYEPDQSTTPVGFQEVMESAIESSHKAAVQRSNDTEEALGNLILLKAMQE